MTVDTRPRPAPSAGVVTPVTPAGCRFFLCEQLLEARQGSWLPTNVAGPDEDVNIYLTLRLHALAGGLVDPRVVPALAPVDPGPDPTLSRAARADWYRANGDHRLLHLGLFDRGETCRRRATPWGLTAAEARTRDLAVAAACYEAAARLLARGPGRGGATAAVLAKLAGRCEEYVHVLGALAVRRLGLGARLTDSELSALTAPAAEGCTADVASLMKAVPVDAADIVLDMLLDYRRQPEAQLRARIERLAPLAGLDAAALLRSAVTAAIG